MSMFSNSESNIKHCIHIYIPDIGIIDKSRALLVSRSQCTCTSSHIETHEQVSQEQRREALCPSRAVQSNQSSSQHQPDKNARTPRMPDDVVLNVESSCMIRAVFVMGMLMGLTWLIASRDEVVFVEFECSILAETSELS